MNLSDPVTTLPFVGPKYAVLLEKLNILTVEDLIHHIPSRLADFSNEVPISDLKIGQKVTLTAEILSINNVRTKNGKNLQIAKVSDDTGKLSIIWMKQAFLLRMLKPGMVVSFFGELKFWGRERAFVFPKFEIVSENRDRSKGGKIMTTYPLTDGLNSKWISKRVEHVIKQTSIEDFLSEKYLQQFELLNYHDSLQKIHFPSDEQEWSNARKRLAFNELLLHQIKNYLDKLKYSEENTSRKLQLEDNYLSEFLASLPFKLTNSQMLALKEIRKDLERNSPMNRLLEGDVGSGKTVVASFGSFVSFISNSQSMFLAPTQVLAEQHFNTLKKILKPFNMKVSLITADKKLQSKNTNVYVGTHALLHRPHLFEKIDYVVIDEQHKFGVKQRAKILSHAKQDGFTPHLLTMTATPIPRTVTLTMYGDLDLTSLEEMPKGRKKIKTWVVPKAKRKSAYEWIDEQIEKQKIQVFVVCPLIEESEAETFAEVKSATSEYQKLKKIFKNRKIGLLHGRLKPEEKTAVLKKMASKKIDILVTTPVVEVGIDIPNATIMMIEAADRFGLAQLHQLRGRVGRGDKQSFCLLFTESKSLSAKNRLKTLEKTTSGRKLAEIDLELRGPGEIFGIKQSGLPELKIASWTDINLIKKTKKFAQEITKQQDNHQRILEFYRSKQITRN